MSDKYSLRLGDEFCFDGSKYEFLSYVRQKLALREKSMTPEMLDTAEGYADSFLDCLLKPTNRDDFTTIPVEEIKLSLEDGEYIGVRDNEENRNHDNKAICVSIKEYEFLCKLALNYCHITCAIA